MRRSERSRPAKAAVFYDGEVCLGGGWIADPR